MADSQGSRRGISSLSGNLAAALVAAAISIPSAVLSHGILDTQRPVTVPEFIGKPEADATKFFRQYQFKPTITRAPSTFAAGLIYDQDPKAGRDLRDVTNVRLFVSTGPVAPPPPAKESTRQDPQGRTSGTKGSISVTRGRNTPWLLIGGVITGGVVALMILARLIKRGSKSPDKASVSPIPVHFDPAMEAEPVKPPRNLAMQSPSLHLHVDLEESTTQTTALVILRREILND